MTKKIGLPLDERDRASDTYKKVSDYLESRLMSHREKNDTATLSEVDTALLRGQIREIKNLLAALQPKKYIEPEINTMRG